MEEFIKIIDTYFFKYDLYTNGKVEFQCSYGELIFNKKNNNIITLYGIYIQPKYRQRGVCRNILQYLIEKSKDKFKCLLIESVMSTILYNYLLRFKYKEKNFKLIKLGFIYNI